MKTWLRLLSVLPLAVAAPVAVVAFFAWRFACEENCRLGATANILRHCQLVVGGIVVYCAFRVAVTTKRSERREGLIIGGSALVLWGAVFGAFLLAAP